MCKFHADRAVKVYEVVMDLLANHGVLHAARTYIMIVRMRTKLRINTTYVEISSWINDFSFW